MDRKLALRLTVVLENFHKAVVLEVRQQRGRAPTEYKTYEPFKIQRFFEGYDTAARTLLDVTADTLSTLLRAQPFPNANHRTMLYVTKALFESNGLKFPWYERRKRKWMKHFVSDCNRFFHWSKYWIRLRHDRVEWRRKASDGERRMYFSGGGSLTVRQEDLDLSNREMATRHRDETARWLAEMLGPQSDKSLRAAPDALTKFLAHAERST